jgi:L-lactate utilization protein LutC
VCPVYSRTGGHAYESVYPGPIGAILTPQLKGMESGRSLPYASSLCGACYEVCPVEIDIPRVLVHLRSRVVDSEPWWQPEKAAMRGLFRAFSSARAFERAQAAARLGSRPFVRRGRMGRLPWPLSGWTETRDLPAPPAETFREWWRRERGDQGGAEIDVVGQRLVDFPSYSTHNRPIVAGKGGDARAAILARIREALKDGPPAVEVPRDYRQTSDEPRPTVIARFSDRVGEYRATVRSATRSDLRSVIEEMAETAGAERLAVPSDLPAQWRPSGAVEDHGLSPTELDTLDGALTGCALAIAETGTIVLDGGEAQGRRALSLVPDYHLCIVPADAIVATVPEAVKRLELAVEEGRPLTFVSGPSATSDIELNRVEGVHGPRTLHVVILA